MCIPIYTHTQKGQAVKQVCHLGNISLKIEMLLSEPSKHMLQLYWTCEDLGQEYTLARTPPGLWHDKMNRLNKSYAVVHGSI